MKAGLVTAALIVAACSVPDSRAQLPPVGPFPDAPCNLANRMNVYIGPDGTLWECVCEALTSGHVCDWYDQGSVRTKPRKKVRMQLRVLPRVMVIR